MNMPSVMPRKLKDLIKFLASEALKSLLGAVANNEHHGMIVRLVLQTGLRREELATFPLAYVIDPWSTQRKEIGRKCAALKLTAWSRCRASQLHCAALSTTPMSAVPSAQCTIPLTF